MMNDTQQERMERVKSYRKIQELIPAHWMEDEVQANGIRQHYYRTGGNKPVVVMLHGFMEGALSWLRVALALQEDYDLIMVDARGHGLSERITGGFDYSLLREDAAAFIRALKLEKPFVIGFSQGATTGILLTAKYPELVRALLVGGWSDEVHTDFAQNEGYLAWVRSYKDWLTKLKGQTHEERMLAGLSQLPPFAPLLPEEEYVPWIEDSSRVDLALVDRGVEMWSELEDVVKQTRQDLERISCPVLLMKSEYFPKQGQPKFLQEEPSDKPNMTIVRFVNSGHLIHREQFEEFVRVIREFLQKQTREIS